MLKSHVFEIRESLLTYENFFSLSTRIYHIFDAPFLSRSSEIISFPVQIYYRINDGEVLKLIRKV